MGGEIELREAIEKAAKEHQPLTIFPASNSGPTDKTQTIQDPYEKEPVRCILCPRRYDVGYITPDWKNPKLLAQFVSPHTGIVYQKHITGLCEKMQEAVEKEVKKAQAA